MDKIIVNLCEICETQYTTAFDIKLCDRCRALKTQIENNFDIVQKIINQREGRLDSISTIEALYPIDSKYSDTREKAKEILLEAILETDWRDLPEEVLSLYAQNCMSEENRQNRRCK